MQFRLNRRITAVVAAAVLGVSLAGGAAYAYWTASGTGNGTITQATTTLPLQITQNTPATGLTPGGPAVELTGNVFNPNNFAVHVTSFTATIAFVVNRSGAPAQDGSKPPCTVDDFTLIDAGVVIGDVPATVGSGATLVSGTAPFSGITIALKNTGANQDNCKNVAAQIAYRVN